MPLAILERYLLTHELRETTEQTYRRHVSTWLSWAAHNGSPAFDEDSVSRFLRDKQAQGCSSHYRRSCRSTLAALLRSAGHCGQVRSVREDPIDVNAWTADEVARLVATVPGLFRTPGRDQFWETLIEAAWLSGLNWIDLRQVKREDVPANGVLHWRRSKTRKPVTVYLPLRLVAHIASGIVWRWPFSGEVFRQQFARIVRCAGLVGSFKTLRKSSATAVETLAPGRGHIYIGDERRTFERHYWRVDSGEMIHPPELSAKLLVVG